MESCRVNGNESADSSLVEVNQGTPWGVLFEDT